MHTRQNYGGLDRFRVVAALLVIAIHTSPLASINEGMDFFLTRILARTAVPFFFMVTGQFVAADFMSAADKNPAGLKKYLRKMLLLYGFCILLYLPIGIYAGHYTKLTFGGLFRMLIFDGTFYHLWYFPACILGMIVVYVMSLFLNLRRATAVSAVLYIIGLLGDSYFGLIEKVPALKAVYDFGFHLWSHTRNGLFLAPLFLLLGVWMSLRNEKGSTTRNSTEPEENPEQTDKPSQHTDGQMVVRLYCVGLLVSFILMTAEAFTLRHFQLQRHDSMYLTLVPVMIFLYLCLNSTPWASVRAFRTASAWIYILHPAIIIAVRGLAKLLHLTTQLVDNSIVHYLVVAQVSVVASLLVLYLQRCVLPRLLPILGQAWNSFLQKRRSTLKTVSTSELQKTGDTNVSPLSDTDLNKKGISDLHKALQEDAKTENPVLQEIQADGSNEMTAAAMEEISTLPTAADESADRSKSYADESACLPELDDEEIDSLREPDDGEIARLREADDITFQESELSMKETLPEENDTEEYTLSEKEAAFELSDIENDEQYSWQEPENPADTQELEAASRKPVDLRSITLPNIRGTSRVMAQRTQSRKPAAPHIFSKQKTADPYESQGEFRAWIEVDSSALEHNVSFLRSRLPDSCRLMPAIKADAYGHGAVLIARQLNKLNVTSFCVACLSEGITLRKAGVKGKILILGYTPPDDFPLLSRYLLTQAVIDYHYARLLSSFGKPLHVHLAIDTGMHRLGIRCENLEEIASAFKMENLVIDGMFTHLSVSDSLRPEDRAFTESQITAFYQVVNYLKEKEYPCRGLHLLASYGILNLLQKKEKQSRRAHRSASRNVWSKAALAADYVRPGIALYGLLSTEDDTNLWRGALRPVLSLKARVISIRTLYTGEAAGYGTAFTAKYDMRIATLSIGYADGLPRELSYGIGSVLINGCMAPIIGRICMDQTIVDVSNIPRVQAGNVAIIIGKSGALEITADHVAEQCGTITNEILSRLGSRLNRILK